MIRRIVKNITIWVVLTFALGVFPALPAPPAVAASKAETLLSKADREFRTLKQKQSLQKYRHNYEKVEKLYRKVFEGYPSTGEAAEALLRCGELYTLLYRWTSARSNLDEARDYYGRVLQEHPRSSSADDARVGTAFLYLNYYNDPVQAYREFKRASLEYPGGDKAREAKSWLRRLRSYSEAASKPSSKASVGGSSPQQVRSSPASPAARSLLEKAEKEYDALKKSSSRQRYRHNYTNVLTRYRRVFDGYPQSGEAETALLRAGELHTLLYRWTSSKSDLNSAKHYYQRLVRDYPGSRLADDAYLAVAMLYLDRYKDPSRAYEEFEKASSAPDGNRRSEAEKHLRQLKAYRPAASAATGQAAPSSAPSAASSPRSDGLSMVTGIRHWSNPEYTRIVIDLDGSSNFYSNLLGESSEQHKPPRLYVDLFDSVVKKGIPGTIPVNDGILHTIRAGQFSPDTVRVVLDIANLENYTIFPMQNPFRIVIDARGGKGPATPRAPSGKVPPPAAPGHSPSLAQQLGLGIRKVVIDPGHGSRDPGAVGYKGLREKDVTLDIALRLRDLLRLQGLEVIMTRDRDVHLGLEERTALANRAHGDLFVSLHANSSRRPNLRGIETYFLNLASSDRAMETAAIENSTSMAKMSDLEEILQEIFNSKMDESSRLAGIVQKNLVENLRSNYRDVKDLGVKQAPFYVLIGAQMPSILAEVSFINHPVEGKRLSSEGYRQHLAAALSAGIMDYIRTVKTAALR